MKYGTNEIAANCFKKHSRMAVCNIAVGVSVVSDSEVLFIFVTLDGEDLARNNSKIN